MNYLARVANSLKLPLGALDADRVGRSDHDSFRRKKVPCIVVHSVTRETLPIINSKKDTLAVIQMDDYYDTYVLMAAYLAYLDYKLK